MTDFSRDVVCIMGLPFDVVDMAQAKARIQRSIAQRSRLVFSTVNVNFIVSARSDEVFRDSILQSELVVADGAPIVRLAKLLGLPIVERVSGADLFLELKRTETPEPIKVYFFGGPEGAAEAASRRLNESSAGTRCVGSCYPGFGSVEEMSNDARIGQINAAKPDFLVVSLGAKKGLEWIDRSKGRLDVPVISHLGAVVNFVAGSVNRAPTWMQRVGLEWAWRIIQEPALWRRYWFDGLALARMVLAQTVPLWWSGLSSAARGSRQASVETTVRDGCVQIKLSGAIDGNAIEDLRDAFAMAARAMTEIQVDVTNLSRIDSRAVGLLLLLHGHQRKSSRALTFHGVSAAHLRQFSLHGAAYLMGSGPQAPMSAAGVARVRV